MINLLQITDSLTSAAKRVAGDTNQDGYLSLWELLSTGGWIMIPLGVMLLAVVYVFAERYLAIREAGRIDVNFMNIIRDHIVSLSLIHI